MNNIIRKAGDAFIHLGIAPTRSLKHLAPENTVIHQIFPGLSFFAVGIFKYHTIEDLRPNYEHYYWNDCYDILVQIPVDYFNTKNLYYIHRLYNNNADVVKWAKGYCLNKIFSNVTFSEHKHSFETTIKRAGSNLENIHLEGKKLFRFPKFLWKFPPFSALVKAFLLFEDENKTYVMQGNMDFEKSYFGISKLNVQGLTLPKPWFSSTFIIKNFDPMHIKTVQTLYHACEILEETAQKKKEHVA